MLPFTGYLQRHLATIAPRAAKVSAGAFVVRIIALICASFIAPQHTHDVFGIRRLHELLGRSAAGFLAIGMLCGCWCAWEGRERNLFAALLFWTWSLTTLLPLSGLCCSESLLLFTQLAPILGESDPPCLAAFRLLAPGFLGMDRRDRGIRISLRDRLLNAIAKLYAEYTCPFCVDSFMIMGEDVKSAI
jgi:hypothetical protein